MKNFRKMIDAAKGDAPSDLILKGGSIVDVFSGEILQSDIAIFDGVIVGVGAYNKGREIVDVEGKWIVPGLIDGHFHVESSMMTPHELAASLLIHGTTTLVSDPHEIANVMGLEGVRFMIEESKRVPFDIFYMAPSCVPATHLETSGAVLKASDLMSLKDEKSVLGLAEVMNFPGILSGMEELLKKIVLFRDDVIDGHCPGLKGNDLQAYLTVGIRSDHEISEPSEAAEKLRSGMMIMIREGTSAKNLEAILPIVNKKNERRFCFVADDLHPEDIKRRGHLDYTLKKAVKKGLDTTSAIRMVTLNPSEYFGLNSTLDPDLDAVFQEYYQLLALRKRNVEQAKRLAELKSRLDQFRVFGSSRRERLALEAVDQYLAKEPQLVSLDDRKDLKDETQRKVSEMWSKIRTKRETAK